jgi:hypothetical protein
MREPLRSRVVVVLGLFVFLCASALPAGRGHWEKRAQKKGWEYQKLSKYTFIEDGLRYGRLTLGANVELAMHRLEDDYLPVIFILASERSPKLHLQPDRFQLILPDGSGVSPVPYAKLMERGWRTELLHDWSRMRTVNPTHGWFSTGYRFVPTRFYPDPAGRRAGAILVDRAHLYGDQYSWDLLYFPNPGGLGGKELQLRYSDPESGADKDVSQEVEVTFVVPDFGAHEASPQTRPKR